MTDKDKKKKRDDAPEQKLGDTPIAPWEMPTSEEKKQAKPVKRALKEAIKSVDSQKKADKVIDDLESAAGEKKAEDVKQSQPAPASPADAAQKVKQAVESADGTKKAEKVLKETAKILATAEGREKEVVSEAAQEVFNPEQQGAPPTVASPREREYLRQAVLKRLKPLDALDANIFLAINHLPHTRLLNGFFYGLTLIYQAVTVWYAEMVIEIMRHRKNARTILREAVIPLLITSTLVELVIKPYFKRRRPFITIIQAIVIGKKPGSWSFPSGHAAGAFAGAWLLNNKFPRFSVVRYIVAALVGFSRIYLGDHYPGDVASGSLAGLLFAMFFNWLFSRSKHKS
jgi:membrane-associated phospholipid phosphatase